MLDGLPVERLNNHIEIHPSRLAFATISGAHLYGFESVDSDFDIRGVHILQLEEVIGLDAGDATIEKDGIYDGLEIDLVTHDLEKFIRLMLRPNGYVLEQLVSPLVMLTTEVHEQMLSLVPKCITRHHGHHYLGFSASQWKKFGGSEVSADSPSVPSNQSDAARSLAEADIDAEVSRAGRVKPLLYTFRTLLTGIHLMRTGGIEANLSKLNELFRLTYLDELIATKRAGGEKDLLDFAGLAIKPEFVASEYERLRGELLQARDESKLPVKPTAKAELNDLLVCERLAGR